MLSNLILCVVFEDGSIELEDTLLIFFIFLRIKIKVVMMITNMMNMPTRTPMVMDTVLRELCDLEASFLFLLWFIPCDEIEG